MNSLTILHSVENWLPMTETWLYNQVRYLPEGFVSHAVCRRTENLDRFPLDHLHVIHKGRGLRLHWEQVLRRLRLRNHSGFREKVARNTGAQILHSHFGDVAWEDIGVARGAGLKHVATFYGHDVNRLPRTDPRWHARYASLFEHVDRVLCEGPFMADSIVSLGCPRDKVTVQHLGVSVDSIGFAERMLGEDGVLRILIAGVFREKKGIPDALTAVGEFAARRFPVEVSVIGEATREARSLREKERIQQVIRRYGLHDKVRFLGFQSHAAMIEEAYRHHVFLSPSVTAEDGDTEGGAPVSIIEMSATGMPIVSTWHCDIPNVVLDGRSGLLAGEHEPLVLADHLQRLIEQPGLLAQMGLAGREHVERNFDARHQAEMLGSVYRALS